VRTRLDARLRAGGLVQLTLAPNSIDSSRPVWIGWAVLAAIVVVVSVVLYQARSQSMEAPQTVPHPAADSPEGRGFRASAWFLPDDPLFGFVEIPAGAFLMGSDPRKDPLAFDNERWTAAAPQQAVDLAAFYIGRFEVTVAQFGAFVEATGLRAEPRALSAPANHPVAWVTWPEAVAYGRWLERALKESGETPARLKQLLADGWHVGLPNEAQWEKAARGSDGRTYPWGDTPRRDRANYATGGVVPVGSISCPECAFNLSDMSGNVWELTRSPYQPYPFSPTYERINLDADALWVMRGGSFGDPERNVRAAVRGGADPGARRAFIGFRVAIYPP
jgi:formylglycine-generating enzyme required for sulfatase activity